MPPKAKTPSEEAAIENPKLDQVLAMLQGMSEKISEFDLRMVAVEKKSDAAREAVDAMKRVDKGDSLENAREQNAVRRRVKFEGSRKYPAESSRGGEEEGDEEIISRRKQRGAVDAVRRRAKLEGSRKYPAESSRGEEEEGDEEIISRRKQRRAVDATKRVEKEVSLVKEQEEVSPRKSKEVLGSKRKQFVARKSLRSHGERRRRWKVHLKKRKTMEAFHSAARRL